MRRQFSKLSSGRIVSLGDEKLEGTRRHTPSETALQGIEALAIPNV